jgi:hypothetical protein
MRRVVKEQAQTSGGCDRLGQGPRPADISEIPPSWVLPLERSIYAFTVLYHPALMAIKAAILILYYRVATAHPFFRRASLITLAVVSVAGIVLTFLCIFQCRPVSAAFNDVAGKCIDLVSLYLSSAPISVLTDLAILILPRPFLTSLRMVVREKVILVATFVMGGFVTIVDVVRIAYLQAVLKEERRVNQFGSFTAINRSPNSSYYLSFSLMWSAVEISVGIICCCILVLKPLVLRVTPKYFGRKTPQQTTTPQWLLKSDSQNRPLNAAQPESPLSPPLSTELSPCYLQDTTSPSARSFPGVDGYQSPASALQSTEFVSDIREAVAWARSANQPVYVLCTEYTSFPCGARCPNPRAHDVPIPVRCTVCQSPCAF